MINFIDSFSHFQELTAICDELISKVGSWQEQYAASCKTKILQTRSEHRSYNSRDNSDYNKQNNVSEFKPPGVPRDRSFVLDSAHTQEVQLRRQRSSSRESARTLRHGTRMTRPVSVPYGPSDSLTLQTLSGDRGRGRHSPGPTESLPLQTLSGDRGRGRHSLGAATTPRRSHADCHTRSSPKVVRKFKVSPNRKKWFQCITISSPFETYLAKSSIWEVGA